MWSFIYKVFNYPSGKDCLFLLYITLGSCIQCREFHNFLKEPLYLIPRVGLLNKCQLYSKLFAWYILSESKITANLDFNK